MLSITISTIAVILSLISLFVSRRKDQRDVFLKLHELLISPDLQNGRRVLFELHARAGRIEDLSEPDYASANRALSALDAAGLYCHKKYVSEKEILDLWAPSLTRMKYASRSFLEHRDAFSPGIPTWPYYRRLADNAEDHLRSRGIDIEQFVAPVASRPPSPADPA
ncbi:hypothetical protein AB0H18_11525 [Streptomyces sp. NPDC020766]|uniref:hypothetical protein n=1 Tax=Streptomyces sp. NPDC020766 TaxID=3155011 RepID=UPI0033F3730C